MLRVVPSVHMDSQEVIRQTEAFVRETLTDAEGGHDWWHIYRVWKNAQHIAAHEQGVDVLVVELGALLHDIADSKFHDGDEEIGPGTAREFLTSLGVHEEVVRHVENIVRHISFKGSLDGAHEVWMSPELAVVQDADRLDALGAIGVARAFSFGGHVGNALYDPGIPPQRSISKEEYKKHNTPTLNHFYEKLLLLKDRMNTRTGKEMAVERHRFLERYLEQFLAEWEGDR